MQTGYIRVWSEQAAIFNHPKDYSTKAQVPAGEFTSVPDWVPQSKMYKLLAKVNKIKTILTDKDVVDIEVNNGKIVETEAIESYSGNNNSATESVEVANKKEISVDDNTLVKYSEMKAKELYEECEKQGIKAEPKMSKEYYIGLLTK